MVVVVLVQGLLSVLKFWVLFDLALLSFWWLSCPQTNSHLTEIITSYNLSLWNATIFWVKYRVIFQLWT